MKTFDNWNEVKKKQEKNSRVFCKQREVWWMAMGQNIGDEENGKGDLFERPILVVRQFNTNLFWGCAMSTKIKENNRYYLKIKVLERLKSDDVKKEMGDDGTEIAKSVFGESVITVINVTTKDEQYYIEREQSVIISQLRLYDTKRLLEKFGFVSESVFVNIKTAIKRLL